LTHKETLSRDDAASSDQASSDKASPDKTLSGSSSAGNVSASEVFSSSDDGVSSAQSSTRNGVHLDQSRLESRSETSNSANVAERAATGRPSQPKAEGSRGEFWRDVGIRVLFVLFLLALWQGMHYLLVTRPSDPSRGALFPSPLQTAQWLWNGFGLSYFTNTYQPPPGADMPRNFWEVLKQADYPPGIWLSILRLLQGYGVAVAIGFPLGLLVARFPLAEKTIGWMASSLQSLPSVCWTPLALLWFGFISVTAPILFVTIMGALFSTIVSVSDGIANVPPLMSRAGRTMGATGPRLYFSVLLPAALPGIVSGLKVGWAFAWRSLMAAEIIVNSGGLGFLLQRDREQSDAEGVVTTIIVIIVIGLGVQALVFRPIERRLQNLWGLNPRS
jgi:NitT/TauT family transport system permease protein